jgi:hypothetical protein
MAQLKRCFKIIMFICSGMASQSAVSSELGTICRIHTSADVLIVERSARGAERLTINSSTYVLRYGGRVYLSTMRRSKTHVVDMTAQANLISDEQSELTSLTAISNIRDYIALVEGSGSVKYVAINIDSLPPATCSVERISPERFSLRSIPVDASSPRL